MSTTYDPRLIDDGNPAPARRSGAATGRQVVVVGDAAFADQVRAALKSVALSDGVVHVESFLDALGEAGTGEPRVIIGRGEDLRDPVDATVRGLRRLLPDAPLILVVSPGEEPTAMRAVRAGFSDYLIEPIDHAELSRLVLAGFDGAGDSPPQAPGERSAPTAAAFPVQADGVSSATPAAAPVEPAAGTPVRLTAAAARAPLPKVISEPLISAPVPAAPLDDAELGDVDLISRLLNDPAGMGDLPLRVVAGRSGISGLSFRPAPAVAPEGQAAAEVRFDGQSLGLLCAPPPAKAEELAPWAHWMAHWVALDQRLSQFREAAFKDALTGAWNWRYFRQFLAAVLDRAVNERFCVTLLLFDIDDFKSYNDRFGHSAGDEILREAARLMQSVVRPHDVVARVGGDEFAVIFWDATEPRKPNSRHPQTVRRATRRFREAIAKHQFPKLLREAHGSLTISGGLAGFPWDGRTPDELIEIADARALESKRQGKNALTFGPGAEEDGADDEPA